MQDNVRAPVSAFGTVLKVWVRFFGSTDPKPRKPTTFVKFTSAMFSGT